MDKRIVGALTFACMLTGCATSHYSEMILYSRQCAQKDCANIAYELPESYGDYVANNPVFVTDGAKFSIELVQINPGWLHQDGNFKIAKPNAQKLDPHEVEHLNGKELWLVTRITALTADSPLELEGKQYFKTSNVKLGTQSFRSMPIDLPEARVFTHAADSTYRVNVRVYEVDGFELKRALLKVQRENPGITGLVMSAWKTVTSTLGALAGDSVVSYAKAALRTDNLADPLLLESLLLQTNATIELDGTFHLFREAEEIKPDHHREQDILLYDPWKSGLWSSAESQSTYANAQEQTQVKFTDEALTVKQSFIRLKVTESAPTDGPKAVPQATTDPAKRLQALPVD